MKIPLAILTLALAALAGPSSAEVPDLPVETHCVAGESWTSCSTTVAGTCTYDSTTGDESSSSLACWHTAVGYCSVGLTPVQDPPNVWCETYQPPGDGSASARADPPCQSGFAQTWCDFAIGPCEGRLTPWTAWGDRSAELDCAGGGAGPRCHAEVHTADPADPEHWCAF